MGGFIPSGVIGLSKAADITTQTSRGETKHCLGLTSGVRHDSAPSAEVAAEPTFEVRSRPARIGPASSTCRKPAPSWKNSAAAPIPFQPRSVPAVFAPCPTHVFRSSFLRGRSQSCDSRRARGVLRRLLLHRDLRASEVDQRVRGPQAAGVAMSWEQPRERRSRVPASPRKVDARGPDRQTASRKQRWNGGVSFRGRDSTRSSIGHWPDSGSAWGVEWLGGEALR